MQLLAQHPTLPPWEALLFVESRCLPYPGENTRNCLFSSVLFKKLYLGLGEPRVGEALGGTEENIFLSVWRKVDILSLLFCEEIARGWADRFRLKKSGEFSILV